MPGKLVTPYQGPVPKQEPFDQVANFPSDPAEKEQLCRFAVQSLKDLVPHLGDSLQAQRNVK